MELQVSSVFLARFLRLCTHKRQQVVLTAALNNGDHHRDLGKNARKAAVRQFVCPRERCRGAAALKALIITSSCFITNRWLGAPFSTASTELPYSSALKWDAKRECVLFSHKAAMTWQIKKLKTSERKAVGEEEAEAAICISFSTDSSSSS